jgi:biotin carboxylase
MRRILLLAVGDPFHRHIDRLKAEGYAVIAVDRDPEARGKANADAFVAASVDDVAAIVDAGRRHRVDAIIAATEAGVTAAAEASLRLGLPGLPIDVARAATDKAEMRRRWRSAGLTQPDFNVAEEIEAARAAVRHIGLPCVVKPTRSWASKGVGVVTSKAEIEPALQDAWAVHGGPLIVERFVPGNLLTAEGFAFDEFAEVVVMGDVETQEIDRHRVNMSLQYPANFSPTVMREAAELIGRAAIALGLRRSPFHCECMVAPGGVVHLVEIAARGGGGHIFTVLYEPMTGFSGIVRQARLVLGESFALAPHRRARGGCYKFLSAPQGIVERIEGVEEARAMAGVVDCGVVIKPGQCGGPVSHDNARHGHVCAIGSDRDEAHASAGTAAGRISFIMRAA